MIDPYCQGWYFVIEIAWNIGREDRSFLLRYYSLVFTRNAGLLVFARDPEGKPTVIVCPDQVTAQQLIMALEDEGWYIQDPTGNDIQFVEYEEDDEDDEDTDEYDMFDILMDKTDNDT